MSAHPLSIQKQWEDFLRVANIGGASKEQLRAMRRAFFAGARAYSTVLLRRSAEPGDVILLESLEAELRRFATDLRSGRA